MFKDKAVTIRGKLAEMIYKLRLYIKPEDKELQKLYENVLENLRKDKSKYVSDKANESKIETMRSNFMSQVIMQKIEKLDKKYLKKESLLMAKPKKSDKFKDFRYKRSKKDYEKIGNKNGVIKKLKKRVNKRRALTKVKQ